MKQRKMVKEEQYKPILVDVEKDVIICDHCGKDVGHNKDCYFCQGTDVCNTCMTTYRHLGLGCYILLDYITICPTCKPKYTAYIESIQQYTKEIHQLESKRDEIELILWKAHNALKEMKQ